MVEDVGEYLWDGGVLFVNVGCEEEAGVDDGAIGGAEGERAFVDGADIDVEVLDVDLFVVDEALEGEVEGGMLAYLTELVVFPFDGNGEGIGLSSCWEDFLEDGDKVEGGRIDDDAEDGIVGGGGDGNGEGGVGLNFGEEERGVKLVSEEGESLSLEVDSLRVELLFAGCVASDEEKTAEATNANYCTMSGF